MVVSALLACRAAQAGSYYSPPPSPGRRVIATVMGPSILKRLTPAPPLLGAGSDAAPAVGAGAAAAQEEAQACRGPVRGGTPAPAVQPSPPPSSAGRSRHPDPFRLWPAPSDPASEGQATGPAAAPRPAAARTAQRDSRAASRALSRRGSMHPTALEMQPSDALEGERMDPRARACFCPSLARLRCARCARQHRRELACNRPPLPHPRLPVCPQSCSPYRAGGWTAPPASRSTGPTGAGPARVARSACTGWQSAPTTQCLSCSSALPQLTYRSIGCVLLRPWAATPGLASVSSGPCWHPAARSLARRPRSWLPELPAATWARRASPSTRPRQPSSSSSSRGHGRRLVLGHHVCPGCHPSSRTHQSNHGCLRWL